MLRASRERRAHLTERAEALGVNGGLVDEYLFAPVIRSDEAEPLLRVEPLHLR